MYSFFSLLIIYTAVVGHELPGPHIVNGTDALLGGHPYMVSLRFNNNHFCGGSIIAKRHILTAAHCLTTFSDPKVLKNVTVHAGTNFLTKTGDVYNVTKVIIHPNYDPDLIRNDIGLFHLKTDIVFKDVVQSIPIATTNSILVGEFCFLIGWGRLKKSGKIPDKLQKLNLKAFSQTDCKILYEDIQDSHICAFSKNGQGACHGDSGSPLVANGIQIGIASFVVPCAVGFPDVYTRVSAFKDWLGQHVNVNTATNNTATNNTATNNTATNNLVSCMTLIYCLIHIYLHNIYII